MPLNSVALFSYLSALLVNGRIEIGNLTGFKTLMIPVYSISSIASLLRPDFEDQEQLLYVTRDNYLNLLGLPKWSL